MSNWLVCISVALITFWSPLLFSSTQGGISLELSTGIPQMDVAVTGADAHYQGFATQVELLLPLLATNTFSMDLDLGYRSSNYQNSASTQDLAEWAALQGILAGFRFNFKYFFFGSNMGFLDGKHLVSGTNSEINSYKINPIQGLAGIHIPLGKVISLGLSYSTYLAGGKATVNSREISVNEQLVMLRLQIDLGIGFFNAVKPEESFEVISSPSFY